MFLKQVKFLIHSYNSFLRKINKKYYETFLCIFRKILQPLVQATGYSAIYIVPPITKRHKKINNKTTVFCLDKVDITKECRSAVSTALRHSSILL